MTHPKHSADFIALREAALEDLLRLSDAELAEELGRDGENLQEISRLVGESLRETAAQAIRQQQSQRPKSIAKESISKNHRPPLVEIKKIILHLFETAQQLGAEERSLGLAFREGKKQTDSDWETLYDDLVRLNAIRPDDDN
ncbi:hypothetical protein [Herbaspirillum sp. RV1423]|uniref:hypothetical protein n=1 Tax=Herbaspirillum sp. RV1423 TaxID=1443993 RepID=UPI000552E670|nr:hypothetical protein [Herbaspirillum sp. RV1423]